MPRGKMEKFLLLSTHGLQFLPGFPAYEGVGAQSHCSEWLGGLVLGLTRAADGCTVSPIFSVARTESVIARTRASERQTQRGTVGWGEDMRRLLGALYLTAGFLVFSHTAHACGDKLLILGRPLRFNSRPAAILAYAPSGSTLESFLNGPQWANAMAKGKHRLRVMQTPEELSQALKAQRFDVILVGYADAPLLRTQVAATSFPAVFVPVVESVARDALRKAEKEYGVAMKGTAKSGDYLSAIDRAVGLHDLRVEAAARVKKNQRKSS
jgi:hypothetical protein